MPISDPSTVYDSEAKCGYRAYVVDQMRQRSLYTSPSGLLQGKWLEPIGQGALTLGHLLGVGAIEEHQFIGIDKHPDDPAVSLENIRSSQLAYPSSSMEWQDWAQFCERYQGNDIRYIVYDLYTSAVGDALNNNLSAMYSLICRTVPTVGQVILAATVDLTATRRHRADLTSFADSLRNSCSGIRTVVHSAIDVNKAYHYRNSRASAHMGVVMVEFFSRTFD